MKIEKYIKIPNILTVFNLFCGFFSVILTFSGSYVAAGWAIFFAAIFDALDGQLARMLKQESSFGKQMDSLADVVSSGLAPAVLVYAVFFDASKIGVFFVFLYVLFASVRLAHFNISTAGGKKHNDYIGLPTPAAALTFSGLVIFYRWISWPFFHYLFYVFLPLICYLVVSPFVYDGFPRLSWKEKGKNRSKIIVVAAALLLVAGTRGLFLFPFMVFYIVLGVVNYKKRS